MKRRHFLKMMGACAAVAFMPLVSKGADRPNFLFIITDDQRHDAMSVVQKEQGEKGRFPWFETPSMDRLASQGVRFRNAFVVNSLCSPSRACFLTGQYNHLNGVINNHTPFAAENVTHATLLKQAGYTTAYFGKWHCGSQRERPGFDHFASFVGQGDYDDCPFLVNGTRTETKGWVDDVTTDFAIEFLKKNGDKPFDMVVGFKSPHDPRVPPERARERFKGQEPRAVPNLGLVAPYRKANPPTRPHDAGGTRDRRGRGGGVLNYFRCISAIDDCLGRILDALDELKLSENTVVVFTSDNGYFFGEHGLGDKRAAYDEALRIPLLVRYPKLIKPNTTNDEMVLNIDLMPTYLGLAGVAVPQTVQGRSWVPVLEGKSSEPLRDAFLYEYFFENNFATPTVTAVRSREMKLIKYPGHPEWTELYDLASDPFETKNLVEQAGGPLQQMEALLERELKANQFSIPPHADKPKQENPH